MTATLIQDPPKAHAIAVPPPPAALAPNPAASPHVPPNGLERRRPGRRDDVSPELIALMRKPTTAARVRVAVYDAPNFILQKQRLRPPSRHSILRMATACVICSVASGAAFKGMLMLWG